MVHQNIIRIIAIIVINFQFHKSENWFALRQCDIFGWFYHSWCETFNGVLTILNGAHVLQILYILHAIYKYVRVYHVRVWKRVSCPIVVTRHGCRWQCICCYKYEINIKILPIRIARHWHVYICTLNLVCLILSPVPYPTIHHSEQKCAHFCSEWCIVGYETSALWGLWDWSIPCRLSGCVLAAWVSLC